MRQGFWKQININDDQGSEIKTLKKEADDSKNQIRVLSESNTDMISLNQSRMCGKGVGLGFFLKSKNGPFLTIFGLILAVSHIPAIRF